MIGLKKGKKKTVPSADLDTLHQAVSELSAQTEALLGSAVPEKAKPHLPKKSASAKPRGAHFDIISPAKKTAKPVLHPHAANEKNSHQTAEHEMLPEHAGLSYNESTAPEAPAPQPEIEIKGHPKIHSIVTHKGSLVKAQADSVEEPSKPEVNNSASRTATLQPAGANQTTSEPAESQPEAPKSESTAEAKDESVTVTVKKSTVSAKEEPVKAETVEISEQTAETAKTEETTAVNEAESPAEQELSFKESSEEEAASESSEEATEVENEPTATGTTAVHANNLVKSKSPNRYQTPESQKKPTVFDTTEVHPELHDWSKLAHKKSSGLSIIILLILIAGGAYLAYRQGYLPF